MLMIAGNLGDAVPAARAAHAAASGFATFAVLLSGCFSDPTECWASTGYVEPSPSSDAMLRRCEPTSNCVSSNYREPPNRYVSPFRIVNDPDVAFRRAVRDLSSSPKPSPATITEAAPRDRYLRLAVPGTSPGSVDDLELLFSESVVHVRCEARVTLPPPPFCVRKDCINGNMDQRTRVERVGRALGLPPSDQSQMKADAKWTPIFFNSDRVPDDYDDF